MGGLSSLMDKLPAHMQPRPASVDMDRAERDIRRKEAIINSMTPLERRKARTHQATRKRRIAARRRAAGSGSQPHAQRSSSRCRR